ncbi:methyltransferase domain-containing protein [Jatrophihabitans sp.]|uniref:class I SAM-dependent methyltransferase n=1 Tax=Jatrophihabitans sp. TaxID=1932789 RepID=UPI0030C77579|nr:hypothetical protein [Jatrophihabitans sp.]
MADDERNFTNRLRAESFGSLAEQYDAYRPGYPAQLIDELAALQPARVLDIGCGTGKAAVLLAARGLDVLGVEVDVRMAAVARRHGITVEVAPFEEWDSAGRTFDLVTCGQAWHWINPARALPRVLQALNPGGMLALFWNYDVMREPAADAIEAVYRELAPELVVPADRRGTQDRPGTVSIEADGGFQTPVRVRRYESERTDTTADWIATLRTRSEYATMADERREPLLAAAAAAIDELGGTVTFDVHTYAILAHRQD